MLSRQPNFSTNTNPAAIVGSSPSQSSLELGGTEPATSLTTSSIPFNTVEMPPPSDPAEVVASGISTNGFSPPTVARLPQSGDAASPNISIGTSEAAEYAVTTMATTQPSKGVTVEPPPAANRDWQASERRSIRAAVQAANRYEAEGNLSAAINAFHYALQIDDTDRLALIGFARLKHRLGDMDGAIVTYRQSLKHHPNDAVAMNDVAICLTRMGEVDEAATALKGAVRLEPNSRRYINNLATILVEQGKVEESLEVLAEEYGKPLGHYNLGHLFVNRSSYPEAARQFQAALAPGSIV